MLMSKTRFLLLLGLALTAGCRGGVTYDSEHDPGTDFSQLRTFEFIAGPPEEQGVERDAVLLGLIDKQLVAKGLQRTSARPDMLVAVHRSIEGALYTKGSGYEIRNGRLSTYPLQAGTLIVDLVSAKTKKGVWRGTASGEFRFDSMPEERRQFLTEVLREMFADYPPGR